ncbi:MAG: hypothetical protein N2689_09660 [Verrucomicrobiae bacterium]|nr:hypothetical protein [Verrucomicrobiae bacterium]
MDGTTLVFGLKSQKYFPAWMLQYAIAECSGVFLMPGSAIAERGGLYQLLDSGFAECSGV